MRRATSPSGSSRRDPRKMVACDPPVNRSRSRPTASATDRRRCSEPGAGGSIRSVCAVTPWRRNRSTRSRNLSARSSLGSRPDEATTRITGRCGPVSPAIHSPASARPSTSRIDRPPSSSRRRPASTSSGSMAPCASQRGRGDRDSSDTSWLGRRAKKLRSPSRTRSSARAAVRLLSTSTTSLVGRFAGRTSSTGRTTPSSRTITSGTARSVTMAPVPRSNAWT